MERNMLSWNIANWITVLLMAAAGYAILAVASQVVMQKGPSVASSGAGGF